MDLEDTRAYEAAEILRIGLILAILALNVYLAWDYVSEQPDWQVTKRKVAAWWGKVVVAPQEAASRMRKAEKQVVFEAMQVVDGQAD